MALLGLVLSLFVTGRCRGTRVGLKRPDPSNYAFAAAAPLCSRSHNTYCDEFRLPLPPPPVVPETKINAENGKYSREDWKLNLYYCLSLWFRSLRAGSG